MEWLLIKIIKVVLATIVFGATTAVLGRVLHWPHIPWHQSLTWFFIGGVYSKWAVPWIISEGEGK